MIELGLQRISRLLADTSMPWRAIHVAGTNGKGSVCAYVSEMLNAWNKSKMRSDTGKQSLSHGRFTSPFLVDPWDCISISSQDHHTRPITSQEFHTIMDEVAKRNKRLEIGATSFELLTATAFEAFTRAKVDVAVVEVGMGGRLDSTNIIGVPVDQEIRNDKHIDLMPERPPPLVSVITKIGMDHQGFLGNSIEEIAHEKAGIVKPSVPVIYDGTNEASVLEVFENMAAIQSAPSFAITSASSNNDESMKKSPPHRKQNHALAEAATLKALERLGLLDPQDALDPDFTAALQHTQHTVFPGRQEQIDLRHLTGHKTSLPALLDGAHNAQSAEALSTYLHTHNQGPSNHNPTTWVLAASDSKDMTSILRPLLRAHDTIYAVEFGPVAQMEWVKPMPAAQILELARATVPSLGATVDFGTDVAGALNAAARNAAGKPDIVITGSLYLVGDVHRLLRGGAGGRER